MNHQPFETWLLSEETLPPEQAKMLREHLRSCEACQRLEGSWAGVRQLFDRIEPAAPSPGFAARWQSRQAEQRRKRHQRQSWLLLAITGGLALASILVWFIQALGMVGTPQQWLMLAIYQLTSLFFFGESTTDALAAFFRSSFGVIPLLLWVFSIGAISVLGVLWIVAYQKITAFWRMRA